MPNLLQTGASWLGARLQECATRTVTIVQGTLVIADITAWSAMHDHEVIDNEGFATNVLSYDWNFVTADLPTDFVFRNGTEITEMVDGVETTYEAMPLGSKPCFVLLDSSGLLLMVHTKRVAKVS